MQSEQINELAAALAKAQAAIPNATMDKVNPHFRSKYASLASVINSMRKPLSENGIAATQTMTLREDGFILSTTLIHASGQWIASEYPLPAVARPQEMGSALTYARRYSLSALICNAADEDDDGEGAERGKQKIDAAVRKPKPPAPNPIQSIEIPSAGAGYVLDPPDVLAKGSERMNPETGEVVAFEDAMPEEPEPPAANREVAAVLSLKATAREAAMRGEDVFKVFYKNRSAAEKKILNAMGDELRGLMPGAQ